MVKVMLETERLIIRDPIESDFDSIWSMRNDKEVTLFTGGITKMTKEELMELHMKQCEASSENPRKYSVVLKETNQYIGYCGFQYCEVLKGIELLYGYSKAYWGKGYAKEAAERVLKFGLEDLELKTIVAAVNQENIASEKVLLSIGMKYIENIEWPNQGSVRKYIIAG